MRMCFLVMPEWWPNQHHRDGITRLPLIARRMKSRAAPGRCGPESITMIDATRPKSIGMRPTRPTQQSNFKCGNRKGRGDGRDERDMTLRRQENKKNGQKGQGERCGDRTRQ